MALSATRLKNAMAPRFKALWRSEPPVDEAQNQDYFLDNLAKIIAEELIEEITTNAKCSGLDSDGDTHDNVGIV